nr:DUF3990 domain-containing protein [uncultured Butyrivibrio sp.]
MIDINKDIILYHGSRGGIDGDIKPVSRVRCDFGRGFYLGENKNQAKGIVVEDVSPYFYTIKLKLSNIPNDRILVLDGREWLNMILANRKSVQEFNALRIADKILEESKKYDVIIGPIADDRMIEAFRRFEQRALTDEGLIACLQSANMGNQYVLKTNFACENTEILEEKRIFGKEEQNIKKYVKDSREKVISIVDRMQEKYQRTGRYLNEIINDEKEKEHPTTKAMETAWDNFFALPKEERNGIEWNGEKLRIAVFDDMYLAKCKEDGITPKQEIVDHFWRNCVDIQGYEPQYCNKVTIER